jgi:hypothetical protein
VGAPDRRFVLSAFRTLNPRKKITIAVSTLGVVAAAAGTISVWSAGATAPPAAVARQANAVSQAAPRAGVQPGALHLAPGGQAAELDAFTAVSAASASKAATKAKAKHHRKLTPRQIARQMLRSFHWKGWQFRYLNFLWSRESSWNVYAANPYSGAYGIPQAVPGSKMASAGPDWESNARTQIRWGMRYIKDRYGSPHGAWEHELATGWY